MRKALPADPERAREVLGSMVNIIEKKIGPKEIAEELPDHGSNESQTTKNKVKEYYYRQDISMEFPGHRD